VRPYDETQQCGVSIEPLVIAVKPAETNFGPEGGTEGKKEKGGKKTREPERKEKKRRAANDQVSGEGKPSVRGSTQPTRSEDRGELESLLMALSHKAPRKAIANSGIKGWNRGLPKGGDPDRR